MPSYHPVLTNDDGAGLAEETGEVRAERDRDRAGERGDVDDAGRAFALGVGEAIDQHEAALPLANAFETRDEDAESGGIDESDAGEVDRGIGEAYVSPQIEAALGFSQEEWLEDPVRWYSHIHPDDKQRWSTEAADMFLTGKPLRSAYRVVARDGRVIWFHCEAKMIRKPDGEPWFIHGVGFDITDLKRAEAALGRDAAQGSL